MIFPQGSIDADPLVTSFRVDLIVEGTSSAADQNTFSRRFLEGGSKVHHVLVWDELGRLIQAFARDRQPHGHPSSPS